MRCWQSLSAPGQSLGWVQPPVEPPLLPADVEPLLPALVEPEPAFVEPAFVEPESDPALVDPESDPAFVEPESDPALVDPESDPAFVEPESDPAFVDPESDPAFVDVPLLLEVLAAVEPLLLPEAVEPLDAFVDDALEPDSLVPVEPVPELAPTLPWLPVLLLACVPVVCVPVVLPDELDPDPPQAASVTARKERERSLRILCVPK